MCDTCKGQPIATVTLYADTSVHVEPVPLLDGSCVTPGAVALILADAAADMVHHVQPSPGEREGVDRLIAAREARAKGQGTT